MAGFGNLVNSLLTPAATPAQIAVLQRIADANTGRSSAMAKSVLCFFFDICYGEDEESDTKSGVYSQKDLGIPQWTYWDLALTEPVYYPHSFTLYEDTILQRVTFRKSDFPMTDVNQHAEEVLLYEDSTGMYYWDNILQEPRVLYDYPAANSITISGGAAITMVAAYNAQGQLMTAVPVPHQVTYSMSVTKWRKGIYFLHMETETGTTVLKMVKL